MIVTNDRTSDLPQRSGSFQAMVRAGDSITAYLRTGKGEPVVLLRRAGHADALWGVLLAEVAGAFRAILPERAPHDAGFAPWFRSFLDGLGLGSVRVVADAHFGVCCAESGLLDPDWLTLLIVVTSDAERASVEQALAKVASAETVSADTLSNAPSTTPSNAPTIVVDSGEPWPTVAAKTLAHLNARPR